MGRDLSCPCESYLPLTISDYTDSFPLFGHKTERPFMADYSSTSLKQVTHSWNNISCSCSLIRSKLSWTLRSVAPGDLVLMPRSRESVCVLWRAQVCDDWTSSSIEMVVWYPVYTCPGLNKATVMCGITLLRVDVLFAVHRSLLSCEHIFMTITLCKSFVCLS